MSAPAQASDLPKLICEVWMSPGKETFSIPWSPQRQLDLSPHATCSSLLQSDLVVMGVMVSQPGAMEMVSGTLEEDVTIPTWLPPVLSCH